MVSRVLAQLEPETQIGTILWIDDQPYELLENEPYIRLTDGQQSRLLLWETSCPSKNCGTTFRTKSGLTIAGLRRRCDNHLGVRSPVKGRRGRTVNVRVEPP